MARSVGPQCRVCRRINEKLFFKGNRCMSDKCALEKRGYPPGQFGKTRRIKLSNYGLQLREKQKVKKIYGVLERQFRNYFETADRKKGVTGTNLLSLLELRLDNVVYRCSFGLSRNHARQIVRHSFFKVNGKVVNIPSYIVKEGDIFEICDKEDRVKCIKSNLELTENRNIPEWLEVDRDKIQGKVIRLPQREDIDQAIEEQVIVELYSK